MTWIVCFQISMMQFNDKCRLLGFPDHDDSRLLSILHTQTHLLTVAQPTWIYVHIFMLSIVSADLYIHSHEMIYFSHIRWHNVVFICLPLVPVTHRSILVTQANRSRLTNLTSRQAQDQSCNMQTKQVAVSIHGQCYEAVNPTYPDTRPIPVMIPPAGTSSSP